MRTEPWIPLLFLQRPFQTTFCQITNVDCLNFKFSGLLNNEKNKRREFHIFYFLITMLFNYQITCPFIVALTCISKVTQPKDIPLFPEAQVLTILWASSLSLPFYLKVDWTWNNVASDEIINIIFLSVAWSTGTQLMTFFCFRFQEMLFGSPGHDLHLSRITSNMLSLQLCFFMELKYDLIVYRGN